MKFKPFSPSYDFSKAELTEEYPNHFHTPIAKWIYDIFNDNDLGWDNGFRGNITTIKPVVLGKLNVLFRKNFPDDLETFINYILSNSELTSNFLALMLQNYARGEDAERLEATLSNGGSAYKVVKIEKAAGLYDQGVYNLERRVPAIIVKQAQHILTLSDQLEDAWKAFYSLNPDYEKTVNKCCDALEHLLRDTYEPRNTTPQLGMLIKDLQAKPSKMNYKGDSLMIDKSDILTLISSATKIRGSHTAGTGRKPTPDESEFILHSTIFIFNMHNKI